jgi:ligand-binding SRPBCC domain-containing protein
MADESPERHKTIFPGMLQILRIGLFRLVPCRWIAEITHVQAPDYFVDEQKVGPFAFWQHRHSIQPVTDGVHIEDSVHYALPMGLLGTLAHHFFVKNRLESLFDYRARMLDEFFGES